MYRRLLPRLFYLTGFVLAVLPWAAAQDEVFAPPTDISLSLSTERRQYRTGEQVVVKYRIVNTSNHRIFVPREWEVKCPNRPHAWAWFEDAAGKHFVPGYAGDCSPDTVPKNVTGRMSKEAVLLKPKQYVDGSMTLLTALYGGLKPGVYRIEMVLYGWREQDFDQAQRSELAGMGAPFLRENVPASMSIRLTP